jgi:hypothetical protein
MKNYVSTLETKVKSQDEKINKLKKSNIFQTAFVTVYLIFNFPISQATYNLSFPISNISNYFGREMEEFSPKRLNHLQKQLLILSKISTTSSDVAEYTNYINNKTKL